MTAQQDSPNAENTGPASEEEKASMEVSSPGDEPTDVGPHEAEPVEDAEEVEPESLDAGFVLKVGAIAMVVLAFVVVLIIQFINLEQREQELTMAGQAEFAEQRALEEQSLEQLQSYGPIGASDSVYHVPIDRAIEYVAGQRYGQQSNGE